MMKRVYICSPLGKDIKENLRKVRRYTKYALTCGTAPVVPHFYAECLDDSNPKEREIGKTAGLSLLWFSDSAIFAPFHTISPLHPTGCRGACLSV